jgi:hypothetical protein
MCNALFIGLPGEAPWRLDVALDAPPPEDFEALVGRLSEMQQMSSSRPEENFLSRLALEAFWDLNREDLDEANRNAAAWASIVCGTAIHGFRLVDERACYRLRHAESDLFDQVTSVADMADFLRQNYASPAEWAHEKQKSKWRAVLASKSSDRRLADQAYRPPTFRSQMRNGYREHGVAAA